MGQWGAGNIGGLSPLESAVYQLNPQAKQAMYAAAQKSIINKGTWNGCAFNAAGKENGDYITSTTYAAEVFGLDESAVAIFINAWDSGSEDTEALKEILVRVGLYTEAGSPKPKRVMFRKYTSWETRMKEELDINIEQDILPEGTEEAAELLFCNA